MRRHSHRANYTVNVWLDVQLLLAGILLSLFPLGVTLLMVYGNASGFNVEVLRGRHEIVYAGLSSLLLVYIQHHNSIRNILVSLLVLSSIVVAFAEVVVLIPENAAQQLVPGVLNFIKKYNDQLSYAASVSYWISGFTLILALVLILAGRASMRSSVSVFELDR